MIIEPLARYDEKGTMLPWLAEEIPTVANGGVSKDLTSISWKLQKGVKWSDGSDFTADDVVFTASYCMDPNGGCTQLTKFSDVSNVEALDSHTVKVTFSKPKPFRTDRLSALSLRLFKKLSSKIVLARKRRSTPKRTWSAWDRSVPRDGVQGDDVITMEASRIITIRPSFGTLTFKGGGDAASAARSVLKQASSTMPGTCRLKRKCLRNGKSWQRRSGQRVWHGCQADG